MRDICICTGEKVDAGEMRFHETVIPMEESYYDSYPEFALENGKWVYNAALVLTPENVKDFAFVDLKVRQLPKKRQQKATKPGRGGTQALAYCRPELRLAKREVQLDQLGYRCLTL